MVQALKMELGGHHGCGLRHLPVSLTTQFSELYQAQGEHQSFSKSYLLAAVNCNLRVSRPPLVTLQPFQTPTQPLLNKHLTSCQNQT